MIYPGGIWPETRMQAQKRDPLLTLLSGPRSLKNEVSNIPGLIAETLSS